MLFDRLVLSNFRNHTDCTFDFSPRTTVIVGKNTSGKTNIMEAIHMLATGKSYRADRQQHVISFGKEIARIVGVIDGDTLELIITSGEVMGKKTPYKTCMVNGVSKRVIDFAGRLKVVLFWPEDLRLITGSPSIRRKYLDTVLIQTDYEYRRNVYSYEKGLRQRNKLLEQIAEGNAERNQLLFWDTLLVKAGSYITDARQDLIAYINNRDNDVQPAFHSNKSTYVIEYEKNVISPARLEQYMQKEVYAKSTLVGPHRDDIVFKVQNTKLKTERDLAEYGSRGEQRMGTLWLKLRELSFIHERTGERPLLLLDDIFSELDQKHKQVVLELIGNQQTIITTADADVSLLHDDVKPKVLQLN